MGTFVNAGVLYDSATLDSVCKKERRSDALVRETKSLRLGRRSKTKCVLPAAENHVKDR